MSENVNIGLVSRYILWVSMYPVIRKKYNVQVLHWVSQHVYRKVSNTRRAKSQNIIASRLILQLSLPNPLKPGVKLRMKM